MHVELSPSTAHRLGFVGKKSAKIARNFSLCILSLLNEKPKPNQKKGNRSYNSVTLSIKFKEERRARV